MRSHAHKSCAKRQTEFVILLQAIRPLCNLTLTDNDDDEDDDYDLRTMAAAAVEEERSNEKFISAI